MCEAKVYLRSNGSERQVMENVVLMQPDFENDAYLLVGLLGEQKLVRGQIEKIDFLKHKIYLRSREPQATERG